MNKEWLRGALSGARRRPDLVLLFAVSALVRLGAWLWVERYPIPLVYDEGGYWNRALGWLTLITGSEASAGSVDPWNQAYGLGHWPPLHPLLLAAAMGIFGISTTVARAVPVLLSTLTTPLIYLFGRSVGGERVGKNAAWVHALYPTFIAFSHYLWAESLSALLLVTASWAALGIVRRERSIFKTRGLAIGCGILCGLGALARAPFLIFAPTLALWIVARSRDRAYGVARGGWVLCATLLTVAPWLWVLAQEEERLLPLTTLSGFNAALGNHGAVPEDLGSSWGDELSKAELRAELDALAAERGRDWRWVAGSIAAREVMERPWAALQRAVARVRMLWTADVFPLRHLFYGAYPPWPPGWAKTALLAVPLIYFALLAAILFGALFSAGSLGKSLILWMVAAGSLPAVATLAMPRLHMPMLVLMLPLAFLERRAVGGSEGRRKRWVRLGLLIGILAFLAVGVPRSGLYLNASNAYGPVMRDWQAWVGPVWVTDRFSARRTGNTAGPLVLKVEGEGRFLPIPPPAGFRPLACTEKDLGGKDCGERKIPWPAAQDTLTFELVAEPGAELTLLVEGEDGSAQGVRARELPWRAWAELDDGVEIFWLGAGSAVKR